MTHRFMPLALVLALTFVSGTAVRAQDQASAASDAVSLSVEVTISRYQGDELIRSLPYMLSVTASTGSRPSTLRFDDRIPVPVVLPSAGPDGVSRPRSFNYENVGTGIECFARTLGDGRYEVNVVIDESFVDGDDQTSTDASVVSYPPAFRSFVSDNTLVLRDGQSRQYLAAADRLGGETIRVDIALTVLD